MDVDRNVIVRNGLDKDGDMVMSVQSENIREKEKETVDDRDQREGGLYQSGRNFLFDGFSGSFSDALTMDQLLLPWFPLISGEDPLSDDFWESGPPSLSASPVTREGNKVCSYESFVTFGLGNPWDYMWFVFCSTYAHILAPNHWRVQKQGLLVNF